MHHIIVNESACWGHNSEYKTRVSQILESEKIPYTLHLTKYPGHAEDIARELTYAKARALIVIGGDGTLNDVINGMMTSLSESHPPIGIIPSGSSNDFSKFLGIPQNPEEACQKIINGKHRFFDIGQAGERFFIIAAALGLFANIAKTSQKLRGFKGAWRYTSASILSILAMRSSWPMQIVSDHQTMEGEFGVLLASNIPRFGSLTLMPEANATDGLLDCMTIETMRRREALGLLAKLSRGIHVNDSRIKRFQTKRMEVTLKKSSLINRDGEISHDKLESIIFRVLPHCMPIFC